MALPLVWAFNTCWYSCCTLAAALPYRDTANSAARFSDSGCMCGPPINREEQQARNVTKGIESVAIRGRFRNCEIESLGRLGDRQE